MSAIDPHLWEGIYFAGLAVCLLLNRKTVLFNPTLISFLFASMMYFGFNFLLSTNATVWTLSIIAHELLLVVLIMLNRVVFSQRVYFSDIALILTSAIQIIVITLTYLAKVVYNSDFMDAVYQNTAPTMYVISLLTLSFPRVFKFVYNIHMEYMANGSGNSHNRFRRVFSFVFGHHII